MKGKEITLKRAERKIKYSMKTTTIQITRTWYEQKAEVAKKMLDERTGRVNIPVQSRRARTEPLTWENPKL